MGEDINIFPINSYIVKFIIIIYYNNESIV